MPSIHSVARQQHLKQERKEKMNNQITLKQLLLATRLQKAKISCYHETKFLLLLDKK